MEIIVAWLAVLYSSMQPLNHQTDVVETTNRQLAKNKSAAVFKNAS